MDAPIELALLRWFRREKQCFPTCFLTSTRGNWAGDDLVTSQVHRHFQTNLKNHKILIPGAKEGIPRKSGIL